MSIISYSPVRRAANNPTLKSNMHNLLTSQRIFNSKNRSNNLVTSVSSKIIAKNSCHNILHSYANSSFMIIFRRNASRLVYHEFGDPAKVVKLENFEEPSLHGNESNHVLVRMLAAPINPAHINIIQGVYPIRPKQFPAVGGTEGIGKVIKIGNNVDRLQIGDLVYPKLMPDGNGVWSTHIKSESSNFDKVTLKTQLQYNKISSQSQENISMIAGLSVLRTNPGTALRMLKDFVPDLKEGDIVIQNGANSAVGQAVIQIAKSLGLVSVNVVRDRDDIDKLKQYLIDMGANYVWTESELRSAKDFQNKTLPKARLALNCVGGTSSAEISKCLEHKGVHVTYGGMSLKPVMASTSSLIFKDITYRGFWLSKWIEKNSDSTQLKDMYNNLESMYLSGNLTMPKYKLVSIFDQEACSSALNNALSGKTGEKIIFAMTQ